MAPLPRLPLLAAAALLASALFACGGGSGSPAEPSASPTVDVSILTAQPSDCPEDITEDRADTVIFGAQARDYLADRFSLTSGDFNADGFDDILVGAPLADGPEGAREDAGEVYVILGGPELPATIDLAEDAADLTLYGGAAGDNFGFTVAAGDVNGDGTQDVLVGARFAAKDGALSVGAAYVVYGGPDLGGRVDIAIDAPDVTVLGRDAGERWAVALAARDVSGDGIDDFIIGASGVAGPDGSRQNAGAVGVVPGGADLPAVIDLAKQAPLLIVHGALPGEGIPNTVSAGDFDADGRSELLIGAPAAGGVSGPDDAPGAAYVVPVPAAPTAIDLASEAGFTILQGEETRDGFGFFVAVADVTGDGVDDAIITARDSDGVDNVANNAGEVRIIPGEAGAPFPTNAPISVVGADLGGSLGFSVATADLDGDGLSGVLAGAPLADGCRDLRPDAGKLYAFPGEPTLLSTGEYDLALFGPEEGDELGFSLASGDLDGDGRDDVITGALLSDGPDDSREDSGQVYVVLSR